MTSSIIIWVTTFLLASLHPTWCNDPTVAPSSHPEPIHCYVCKSDKDAKCTPLEPSGDAIPSKNCEDPNKLFNEWLGGQEFTKLGLGSINFHKLMGIANEKAGEKTENVTACLYLYISDENTLTTGLDQSIKKARSFIPGDKGAGDAVSVKRWIFRDCISVQLDHEGATKMDKCVPVDTGGTGQAHLCTCRSDKCNEPHGSIMGYLKKRSLGTDDKSAGVGIQVQWQQQMMHVLISLALVGSKSLALI